MRISEIASLFACLVIFGSQPALTQQLEMCGANGRFACVVDGDTFWLNGAKYRPVGYDTPEPYTNICGGEAEIALGHRASERFLELLNTTDWQLQPAGGADQYGRILVHVFVDGEDVADILIREGLARRWPNGHAFWCD